MRSPTTQTSAPERGRLQREPFRPVPLSAGFEFTFVFGHASRTVRLLTDALLVMKMFLHFPFEFTSPHQAVTVLQNFYNKGSVFAQTDDSGAATNFAVLCYG